MDDEEIVSIVEHKGNLYVATRKHIYIKIGDEFKPIKIEIIPTEED
jgi:hypothetical protein